LNFYNRDDFMSRFVIKRSLSTKIRKKKIY